MLYILFGGKEGSQTTLDVRDFFPLVYILGIKARLPILSKSQNPFRFMRDPNPA